MKKLWLGMKKELRGLRLLCKALVDTTAASTPKDFERYKATMSRFTFLINEKAYERQNPTRSDEIEKEQIMLKAELDRLRFTNLASFETFREHAERRGLVASVDHMGNSISVEEGILSLSLAALSTLETILRLYSGHAELPVWREAAGCAIRLTSGKAYAEEGNEADAKGFLLIHLTDGFSLDKPAGMPLERRMREITDSMASFSGVEISQKALLVAEEALTIAGYLPMNAYDSIMERVIRAAGLLHEPDEKRISMLVHGSLSIKKGERGN